MKIIAVADIHGSEAGLTSTLDKIKRYEPELVIVCGDITHYGPPGWARLFLEKIPVRTFALPGNCDPPGVLRSIEESGAVNLHKKRISAGNLNFVGFGGSNYTPFGTPLEFSEEHIYAELDSIMVPHAILVVHAPPKGHLDSIRPDLPLGSEGVARIVNKYRPLIVISGHIHEARGVEHGDITYINPGPARDNYAALLEIASGVSIKSKSGIKVKVMLLD
jgi:hypothetical protein